MRARLSLVLVLTTLPLNLAAQEESGGGFIGGLLESALSGENRNVTVTGLSGALSSSLTLERLTMSDDQGVWLTISGATLDWTRSALLRGRLDVSTLSAESIVLERLPAPSEDEADLPSPEATPFQLPELPVAVSIGEIAVNSFSLGEPVVGIAAELSLAGALTLAEGALDTDISVTRLDRPSDVITLDASFSNETSVIALDFETTEAQGGLLSELLNIPGRPSVNLTAAGEGPLTDFTADIALATDGAPRVTGQVRLRDAAAQGGDAGIAFEAGIAGDVTPLIDPQYHAFFGPETQLALAGRNGAAGGLEISEFRVEAAALDLTGALATAASGGLSRVRLDGRIAAADGDAVLLPGADPATSIRAAEIAADFDAAEGNGWTLTATVAGLARPDLDAERAALTAGGTLDQSGAPRLVGSLTADLQGLAFADPRLQQAVGDSAALAGQFDWTSGGRLSLSDFALTGSDYAATLDGAVDGLDSGFALNGTAAVEAADLARFSGLAGRDLGGAITARVAGSATPLSGAFDLQLTASAQDLAAGIAALDPLIAGQTTLALDAARGTEGTDLRRFTLEGTALSAEASGTIRSAGTQLTFEAALDDLGRVVPAAPGPVTLTGDVTHDGDTAAGTVALRAPNQSAVTAEGTLGNDGAIDARYDAVLNRLEVFVPQLAGSLTSSGEAARSAAGAWTVSAQTGGSVGLDGAFDGSFDEASGAVSLSFDAALERLERLVPKLAGGLSARGTAERSAEAEWQASLQTGGSAGIAGQFSGSFAETTGAADLQFDALFQRLERFVPQLAGSLAAEGRARRSEIAEWEVTAETGGTAGIVGAFSGGFSESTGAANLRFDAALERLERLVPQLAGTVSATGSARRSDSAEWTGQVETGGSAGVAGQFNARFAEATGAASLRFDAALERLERLVPGFTGTLEAKGRARRSDTQDWQVNAVSAGSAGLSGTFKATFDEALAGAEIYFDAAIERLQRLVPDISGTLTAAGLARKDGDVWSIDTTATGPGSIAADVDGSYDQARNSADITARGNLQLGLANTIIRPNSLRGAATFDLALRGQPGLEALSGTVRTSGATVVIPAAVQTITGLDTTVTLSNGRAQVATSGALRAGGQFRVSGPVDLSPPFAGALDAQLNGIVLTNNLYYSTTANGQLRVSGPLAGGATISGRIDFPQTEINIANASGSFSAAPIPPMRHIGEPRQSRVTRARAGLLETSSGASGPAYNLDITLNAPGRVFVRGRGLNAELGGSVLIRGTSANVVPSGQISLIRGTFDLLGRRLTLDQGSVSLQGALDPVLNFVASTTTSEGEAMLTVSGPVSAPEIEVTATPERPSEEALALLLFGDRFSDLSPLKLAQLGSQLATLSGRGGGLTERLRTGLGVDSLDVGTDDDGTAQVGVGRYIADDVYTDVTINAEGESEVNLNFDLTDTLTIKGSVDNEGETGVGLFFQRDY